MVEYVTSLEGKHLIFTGYLMIDGENVVRRDAIRLARRHDARVSSNTKAKVSRFTDILVRGDNPNHSHGDWGDDEEEVARLQRAGVDVVIIDGDGFGALLQGGWAPVLPARSLAPRLPDGCQHYRPANASVVSIAELPPERDSTAAMRAHHQLQEAIAEAVRKAGYHVVSPKRSDAAFDVGWVDKQNRLHIVEVKSIDGHQPSAQIRLGVGQILDYWERLQSYAGYLALTGTPPEIGHWRRVCGGVGIVLLTPDEVDLLLP